MLFNDDEYESNEVEEFSIFEGNTQPLENDRTGELAMECWNLRKTILEQSSSTIKQKQEIKSHKNLLKNLQKLVGELQTENLLKSRELVALKGRYQDLERKLHDQVVTNHCMNSSSLKAKKNNTYLTGKVHDLQNENKLNVAKHAEALHILTEEMKANESAYALSLKQLTEDKERLIKENLTVKSYFDESVIRISQLEAIATELKHELQSQSEQYIAERTLSNSTHEMAYDDLQSRLEDSLHERERLRKHAAEKDHENYQLSAYILVEGLQFPLVTKLYRDDELM